LRPFGRVVNSLSGILEALSCRFNQPNTRKQSTDISTQLHKISQTLTPSLRNAVAEYKVARSLPPSGWWTPRRLPLRPRQLPPLRQGTPRNDQIAHPGEPSSRTEQSNQEPAVAARREANHRRVPPGASSGEQLQRQAKAGRRAALLPGSGRARRGEREMEGTTESSMSRGRAAAADSEFLIFSDCAHVDLVFVASEFP
jgi:hypothetical protein